jgi:hypothetical protein
LMQAANLPNRNKKYLQIPYFSQSFFILAPILFPTSVFWRIVCMAILTILISTPMIKTALS